MNDHVYKLILLIFNTRQRVTSCMDHKEYPYALHDDHGKPVRYMRASTYNELRRSGLLHCGLLTDKSLEIIHNCHK